MLHDMNNVLVLRPTLILDQHMVSPDIGLPDLKTDRLLVSQNISSSAQFAEPAGRALSMQ